MDTETKITINTFKTVIKSIAHSSHLDTMSNHLSQLLVAALEIKACAILMFDMETKQMERLASYGLSARYLTKGPVMAKESIAANLNGDTVIVSDVNRSDRIQYPEEAEKEGIKAILSIPIMVSGEPLAVLRLYHHQVWEISKEDLDSLQLLSDFLGLAMNYTNLLRAIYSIEDFIRTGLPVGLLPRQKKT